MTHSERHSFKDTSFSISWVTPYAPSSQSCFLLDIIKFRVGLQSQSGMSEGTDDFRVELWTNLYHQENNEGEWHGVDMPYMGIQARKSDQTVTYLFGVDLMVTCMGIYKFTFRARHKWDPNYEWAQVFGYDGVLEVKRQTDKITLWTQKPEASQITHNIWIGNYAAAIISPEVGYDCLVNMADDAEVFQLQLGRPIIFKKFPIPFGADYVIEESLVKTVVMWLRALSNRCRKILLVCREGKGRVGSIMTAFIFAMNPNLSFEEAFKFVNDRHMIYTNKGLKNTLHKLFPRE